MSNPNLAKRIGESSRQCPSCMRELPGTAKYFPLCPDKPAGLGLTCIRCRNRNGRQKSDTRKGRHCFECCALPHRRPKRGLCSCGGRYEAEPAMTIDAAIAARRDHSRTVVL